MKAGAAVAVLVAAMLAAWAGRDASTAGAQVQAPAGSAPARTAAPPSNAIAAQGGMFQQFAALGEHTLPAGDIALTDDQQLIPDMALKKVMDAFLLDRALNAAQAMQALTAQLRRTLPPGAATEAVRLAARYQAYLAAHDDLLAAQHFTSTDAATQDPGRILGWQQQRQQLRLRTLGERVALEWFGNDDAYLDQALAEWRQRSDGTAPTGTDATIAQRDQNQSQNQNQDPDQALHDQHMRVALDQAIAAYRGAAGVLR